MLKCDVKHIKIIIIMTKNPGNSRNGNINDSFCSQEKFIFFIGLSAKFLINSSFIKNTYILASKYWNNWISPHLLKV